MKRVQSYPLVNNFRLNNFRGSNFHNVIPHHHRDVGPCDTLLLLRTTPRLVNECTEGLRTCQPNIVAVVDVAVAVDVDAVAVVAAVCIPCPWKTSFPV